MKVPLVASLLFLLASQAQAQFGTAAQAIPPPDIPKRGDGIKPPKVRRHYPPGTRDTVYFVEAMKGEEITGARFRVTCGYRAEGRQQPTALDTVWLAVTYGKVFSSGPGDPPATLDAHSDSLQISVPLGVAAIDNSALSYQETLPFQLPLEAFRELFDADSVDLRVRKRTYHLRGRAVESCRWLGDRLGAGIRPT